MKISINQKIKGFILLTLLLALLGMADIARADVSYDAGRNTIFLESGTNTLASIDADPDVPESALNYNSETNTYTLSANITGAKTTAHLNLSNTTLVINSTAANKYRIKTYGDLIIYNMTLKAVDSSYIWEFWAYDYYLTNGISINNSDLSGGRIVFNPDGGYKTPAIPIIIKNNRIHDTSISVISEHRENGVINFRLSSGDNAIVRNNTFDNVKITSGQYNGILRFEGGAENATIDGLYIYNSSTFSYGMTYIEGGGSASSPTIISNFVIKDSVGGGLTGKEYGNVKYVNGTIKNVTSGVSFYQSYNPVTWWVWNVTIDKANVAFNGAGNGSIADIYDVMVNDVNTVYDITRYDPNPFILYITNSKYTNYNRLYNIVGVPELREYVLADINVTDSNGNPVNNATVTIASNANVSNYSINRNLQPITWTTTLANGHTPLPNEDPSKTIALLRLYKNSSSEQSGFTYTITASKNGYSNSTTVTPDASWYRIDPNTYQNTVVITLPMALTPSAIDINLDGTIDISDLRIVVLHFGESTTSPYPRYDVDANGTVDILDLRQVAGGM